MKKFISSMFACLIVMGYTTTAFAAYDLSNEEVITDNDTAIVVDMNDIDVTKPHEITKEYVNDHGETVTLRAVYTPVDPTVAPMWSNKYDATVGTWTSYYDGGILNGMSYDYDVSKSGSHWKISNARNLTAHCILSSITDKSLTINRSTSTSVYPAEVIGICTVEFIDTPIGHVSSIDAWIKTTISDRGTLTVSGN